MRRKKTMPSMTQEKIIRRIVANVTVNQSTQFADPIIELMSMNALCNGPIVKTEKKATKKSSKHVTKVRNICVFFSPPVL